MSSNFYDAVVMGMDIGPLVAGALLAKRGFRVLVVGQEAAPDPYPCLGFQFVRKPFLFSSSETPIVRRIVSELGIGPQLLQLVSNPAPNYQVIQLRARTDIYREIDLTLAEMHREFPDSGPSMEGFLAQVGELNGEIDKLLGVDLVIPPEGFIEKREVARSEIQNPFQAGSSADLLAAWFADNRQRAVFEAPLRALFGAQATLSPLVAVRQLGGWLWGCQQVKGGYRGLAELFVSLIVSCGGERRQRQRIGEIVVDRGRVRGVRMAGQEEVAGCQVIFSSALPSELAPLIAPSAWPKRFRAWVDADTNETLGYAVNLGVDEEVIPAGLAATAFVVSDMGTSRSIVRVQRIPQSVKGRAALHVSTNVSRARAEALWSGEVRDELLDQMRQVIPYLDNYLHVLHSPYDGFGPINLTGKNSGEAPLPPHPEEIPVWKLEPLAPTGVWGIGHYPHRTGLKGLLLAGAQVVSGLGVEGELLAAWGAARIAGKMDPSRERITRAIRG